MSLTMEKTARRSTKTFTGRRVARAAAVLAASAGLIFSTTTAASAGETDFGTRWAPPVCAPEMQVQAAVVMTTVWYPTGGGYSAGRGYYTFRVKAVTYIGGVEGAPIEGTSYCFPD